MLLREKESKLLRLQKERKGRGHYNTFNEQQCHVTNIYTVEEKQKYHITSRSSYSPENVFLRPLLF